MEVTEILRCPKTGHKLRFDDANSVVVVEDSPITYPINDGIVDFCPEVKDKVSRSYDGFASGYDAYFTSSSLSMKLFNLLFFGGWNYSEYSETVLSYFPSQFDGVLLDVPVGTGLVTASQYAQYPNATIESLRGLIDLVMIKNANRLTLLNLFRVIMTGQHLDHKLVTHRQLTSFELQTNVHQILNIDGELKGYSPFSVRILPKAIELLLI